jgi:ABC-type nitrate/sulfonate/bicarbonate transport system substrate-binding protein
MCAGKSKINAQSARIFASAIIQDARRYADGHPAEYAAFLAKRGKEKKSNTKYNRDTKAKGPRCGQRKEVK